MADGLLLQYLVIASAVIASGAYVVQKQFPAGVRRLRVALALPLLRDGRAGWLRALGSKLAPARLVAEDGCGSCNGCAGH